MKRLGLFAVALVFAFCTTVMAAEPVNTPDAVAPATEKADVAKVKKHHKKHHKHHKKEMKEEAPAAPADAPATK